MPQVKGEQVGQISTELISAAACSCCCDCYELWVVLVREYCSARSGMAAWEGLGQHGEGSMGRPHGEQHRRAAWGSQHGGTGGGQHEAGTAGGSIQ